MDASPTPAIVANQITVPLYKVLVNGHSCHGGSMTWPLPTQAEDGTWTPGEWVRVEGALIECQNALHLTDQPAEWYQPEGQCWLAEHRGETVGELSSTWQSKIGVREARLMCPVAWDDVAVWSEGDHTIKGGISRAYNNATVKAYGNATVKAYGNATVRASGSATVRAYDSATVEASGSATVRASGSATVRASDSATVRASDSATVKAYGNATVTASGSATVTASDNATVTASGSATVTASDNATVTASGSATVRASGSATAISDRWHSPSAVVALNQLAAHVDRRGGKLVLRGAAS